MACFPAHFQKHIELDTTGVRSQELYTHDRQECIVPILILTDLEM